MALDVGRGRLPRRLRYQQQRVEMGDEANLVPLNLILTATLVFCTGGREALAGREQLLEAQLRFDLGELSDQEFAEIERDLLVRIREIKGAQPGGLTLASPDVRVVGVETEVAEDLREP